MRRLLIALALGLAPAASAQTEPASPTATQPETAPATAPSAAPESQPVTAAPAATQSAAHPPPATRPAAAVPARADFAERYAVIADANIFLRDRGRASSSPPREPSTQPATAPAPEQTFALTGIVFEGSDLRAYFENLADGSIIRVEPEGEIARGRIAEIAVGAVAYESGGRVTWIEIGHDLTGSMRIAQSPSTGATSTQPTEVGVASPPPQPGPPAAVSATPPSDPAALREWMRQRRRQQGGQ